MQPITPAAAVAPDRPATPRGTGAALQDADVSVAKLRASMRADAGDWDQPRRERVQLIALLSHGDGLFLRTQMPRGVALSTTMTLGRFRERIAASPGAPAMIDLEYCRATDLETLAALTQGLFVFAYVSLNPNAMRRLARFASQHAEMELVIRGHDDLLVTVRAHLARIERRHEDALIAHAVGPLLAALSAHLASVMRDIFLARVSVETVDELARLAYMSRRRVERSFHAADLAPPQRFLTAASLLRHFGALASPDVPCVTVCRLLHIGDSRTLDRHCRAVSGLRLVELRSGMAFASFLALATARLQRRVA